MRKRRHPITGAIYTADDEGHVVVEHDGKTGVFDARGRWLSGEVTHADPHLCLWLAGPQLPSRLAMIAAMKKEEASA